MPLEQFLNLGPLQNQEPVRVPATAEAKESLKKGTVKDMKESGVGSDSCPICVENFDQKADDAVVVEMPCGHKYCEGCLMTWLEQNHNCPTCRKEIEGRPEVSQ